MKHEKSLLLLVPGVAALAAFVFPADAVRFAPKEGLSLTKVFTNQTTLTVDSMEMIIDGQPMPEEMGDMEMDTTTTVKSVVTDVYTKMAEGRPHSLRRTYDELTTEGNVEMGGMAGDMEQDFTGSSELEGKAVVFTWSDEEGEYAAAFAEDDDADPELLEDLWEDMDLRDLLPTGSVEPGATWRIENDRLVHVLAAGGDMKILPDDMEEMASMGPTPGMSTLKDMMGEVTGSAIATYTGKREVDGVEVGVIEIKLDISGANDITDLLQEMTDEMPIEMEAEVSYDAADIEFELKGEGELLWNLAGGHLHRFELDAEMAFAMDMAMVMSMMGQDMEMEMNMEMSGNVQLGAATRDGE